MRAPSPSPAPNQQPRARDVSIELGRVSRPPASLTSIANSQADCRTDTDPSLDRAILNRANRGSTESSGFAQNRAARPRNMGAAPGRALEQQGMGSGDYGLALAAKLAITAAFVVGAARTAERAGPLIGAMVATLPIAAGPAYVFLALDHDASFIAASALA